MQQRTKDALFILMILLVVVLGVYLVIWTTTEGYRYATNPLGYSFKQLEQKNGEATAWCQGVITNSKGMQYIYVNDSGIYFSNNLK